jgi:retron-type reverse transcriptase
MSLHLAKSTVAGALTSFGDLCRLFECPPPLLKQIADKPEAHYGYLAVPKGEDSWREIRPPNYFLRQIQRCLLRRLYDTLRLPNYLHGGLPNRSIVTHATRHVGQPMVGTFDIRNFYPSTTRDKIEPVLFEAGFRGEAASVVASLVLFGGTLPQGAPTSGLLANLAFIPVDRYIRRFCRRHELRFTRFVDDVAISGAQELRELGGAIGQMVLSCGYELATEKTRFYSSSERQIVTGLVVNNRLRPTKEFVRGLKAKVRFCLEFGAQLSAEMNGISVRRLREQINGLVSHVRHVDPELGERLRRMLYGIKWAVEPQPIVTYQKIG